MLNNQVITYLNESNNGVAQEDYINTLDPYKQKIVRDIRALNS
jgi:hypothetical protein